MKKLLKAAVIGEHGPISKFISSKLSLSRLSLSKVSLSKVASMVLRQLFGFIVFGFKHFFCRGDHAPVGRPNYFRFGQYHAVGFEHSH